MGRARTLAYRWFGFLSFGDGDGLCLTWLQATRGWGLAFNVGITGDDPDRFYVHLSLVWGHVYLTLPIRFRGKKEMGTFGPSWGGSWAFNDAIHFHWGERCKIIYMPWTWEWVRTSYLAHDGTTWFTEYAASWMARGAPVGEWWVQGWRRLDEHRAKYDATMVKLDGIKWRRDFAYTYTLRSGEVQKRVATVTVEEREWRRRWTYWFKLGAKVRRTIAVEFDQEVGERSGTWKGGVLGCGYEMRPGESAEDCLRRMERERKL